MSPQAKAVELLKKINDKIISFENVRLRGEGFEMSKQCALMTVHELINDCDASSPFEEQRLTFWIEVKAEIEKL